MELPDIPLIPPPPDCYCKKDYSFVSISTAEKTLHYSVEELLEQMKNGERESFAQKILTDTDKYPDGREYLRKPVFRITALQLECVLENKGYTIDLDPELNGWMMGPCPPRQVRIEVKDLLVLLPNFNLSDFEQQLQRMQDENMSREEIIVRLVEQHKMQYGFVARKLFDYPDSSSKATWRKRGEREYKKAKICLAAKNATLSHPVVTP